MELFTVHLLQRALDGAGAAGAVHLDVELVGVFGHGGCEWVWGLGDFGFGCCDLFSECV